MKFNKIYLLFIIASIICTSCGDDDTEMALQYNTSTVEPFSVFAGSANGGQRVPSDSIKRKVSVFFPDSIFEGFSGTLISFQNNVIIIDPQSGRTGLPEKSIYKFDQSSLFLNRDTAWRYIGEGNQKQLTMRQHYVGYKQRGDTQFHTLQLSPQKDIDSLKAVQITPFVSLQMMTSVEDTLIFCTRSSTFR